MSSITYDPINLKSNWTSTPDFCNWIGVSCSPRRQRVTALRLRNLSLAGTISPHIGNLSFLADLNLHNNSFHGNVVIELGRLKRLRRLSLGHNNLEGKIPGSLQNCRKLEQIYLTDNNLIGSIPQELTILPSLQILFLGVNNLSGKLPVSLGNISSLELFGLENNNVVGSIPGGIVQIPGLKGVNFFGNYLSGLIPLELFNMSTLQQVLLSENNLSGTLPKTTGLGLPNLEMFDLATNQLTGEIPLYLSNASKLNELSLSENRFHGPVRINFGHLTLLERFGITDNRLTVEPESFELSFLTSMTNCTSLQFLVIDQNPWGGFLPNSIGNLSSTVQRFGASSCQLQGSIPRGIGYLKVNVLELSDNNLKGTIPSTIGNMWRLQRLYLDGNKFEGSLPDEICLLSELGEMYLQGNKLSGPIPSCIGNLIHLQILSLDSNKLNSSIPSSLWLLQGLSFLNLSSNFFDGTLVMESPLKSLESIDLSWNKISGRIPSTIGAFQTLLLLNLSRNSFSEHIPESFSSLITLDFLDLSHNNLSGEIPTSLERLSQLKFLNLSFNKFSGEIPRQGPFKNFTALSFLENAALCGMPDLDVPPCASRRTHKTWIDVFAKFILPSIAGVTILVVALVYIMNRRQQNIVQANSVTPAKEYRRFAYQELCRATNDFCDTNLLGVGSYGSVYKAVLPDGEIVAVKILNLQLEGALKSFDAECKVFRAVRHRNLVKVISTCSNLDLRAIVLQYMPKGSVDKWLYSHNYSLSLLQRLAIMIDVALAMDYLHHGQEEPIIHCDLKPNNVLLDEEMVAHVSDFGIAKILAKCKTTTQTKTLGTIGYIAPEYGSEGRVSTKGDIYSYGIMLLEILSRKKPTDEMFTEELTLRQWVNSSLPNNAMEVIDNCLVRTMNSQDIEASGDDIFSILELGLQCSAEFPEERPGIKEVLFKLNKVKLNLQRSERI